MKQFTIIFLSILIASYNVGIPSSYEKKIDKEINSYFDGLTISKELIKIPDNLNYSSNNYVFALKLEKETVAYMNFNKVNACRVGGCSNKNNTGSERYDHFYYMSLLDTNFTILKVKIIDYQSEYGFEICGKSWLKQFIGKKGNEIDYGKNIDAISGATVSGNALVSELQMLNSFLNKLNSTEYFKSKNN